MKKINTIILTALFSGSVYAATPVSAGAEVVCAYSDGYNSYPDPAVINKRLAALRAEGKNLKVSVPSVSLDTTHSSGLVRGMICVTASWDEVAGS